MNNIIFDNNMSIDEILELWVKYSFEMFNGGNMVIENVETRQKINALLNNKGITALEIYNISDDKYTLRFIHRGSKKTKVVPIKS